MLEVVVGVAKRLVVVTTVVRSAPEFIWNIYRNNCGYVLLYIAYVKQSNIPVVDGTVVALGWAVADDATAAACCIINCCC